MNLLLTLEMFTRRFPSQSARGILLLSHSALPGYHTTELEGYCPVLHAYTMSLKGYHPVLLPFWRATALFIPPHFFNTHGTLHCLILGCFRNFYRLPPIRDWASQCAVLSCYALFCANGNELDGLRATVAGCWPVDLINQLASRYMPAGC